MKKRLSLLLLPILLLMASCQKQTNYVTPNQTILTTVYSNNWTTATGGKTYSAYISTPEIDYNQNRYGAVLVYATFDNGVTYEQVPEVYNGVAYSFTHSVGQVEIDIQSSNGTSVISPPGTVGVKIVLVASSL